MALSAGHIVMASKPTELAAIANDVVGRDEQLPAPEDAQSPLSVYTNTTESNMQDYQENPLFASDESTPSFALVRSQSSWHLSHFSLNRTGVGTTHQACDASQDYGLEL